MLDQAALTVVPTIWTGKNIMVILIVGIWGEISLSFLVYMLIVAPGTVALRWLYSIFCAVVDGFYEITEEDDPNGGTPVPKPIPITAAHPRSPSGDLSFLTI